MIGDEDVVIQIDNYEIIVRHSGVLCISKDVGKSEESYYNSGYISWRRVWTIILFDLL